MFFFIIHLFNKFCSWKWINVHNIYMAFWACVFANMFHFGESTCTTFRWVFKIRDLLSCVSSNIWHLWDLINMHCTTLTYHMDLKKKFLKSEPSCLHAGYPWEPSMTYHTDLKNLYFLGRPLLPFQKCRGGHIVPPTPPGFWGCWWVMVSNFCCNLISYSDWHQTKGFTTFRYLEPPQLMVWKSYFFSGS